MFRGVGPWNAGAKISLISRDGQFVSGFGVRNGTPSGLVELDGLCAGLLEGEGGALGDADRFGVISQSIRLKVVNYV